MTWFHSALRQNLMYGLILGVVGIGGYLLRPTYTPEPHGIFLPANVAAAPANTGSVEWREDLPPDATVLGKISMLRHFDSTDTAEMETILSIEKDAVTEMAKRHGANLLVVDMAGRTPGTPNPLDNVTLTVTAAKQ